MPQHQQYNAEEKEGRCRQCCLVCGEAHNIVGEVDGEEEEAEEEDRRERCCTELSSRSEFVRVLFLRSLREEEISTR